MNGSRIIELRKVKGIGHAEFAGQVGVTQGLIPDKK
jgi:transcriptional regulator with XRE-family HTH domain